MIPVLGRLRDGGPPDATPHPRPVDEDLHPGEAGAEEQLPLPAGRDKDTLDLHEAEQMLRKSLEIEEKLGRLE
ncbi:MAG: hypothetical protein ACE5I4_04105, partial [Thermoplasmata archaeon]